MSIAPDGLDRGHRLIRALYAPREAEAILGVSHATLYRLISAGRLDARKIGSKTGITAKSIEAFLTGLPKIGQVV